MIIQELKDKIANDRAGVVSAQTALDWIERQIEAQMPFMVREKSSGTPIATFRRIKDVAKFIQTFDVDECELFGFWNNEWVQIIAKS